MGVDCIAPAGQANDEWTCQFREKMKNWRPELSLGDDPSAEGQNAPNGGGNHKSNAIAGWKPHKPPLY